jgi:two-component system OmpR family sensor kinase
LKVQSLHSPAGVDQVDGNSAAASDAERAEELARLRAELALRDDILSVAAHELRNPLHALSLHLALARTQAEAAGHAELAERVRRAELTLRRYTERVTVLMDLLGSSRDAYPLHPRTVDIAALLRALAESFEQEARSRDIALRVEAPATCMVTADPLLLEQVADNLVLNAFKHSGATLVTLRCRRARGQCILEVEDNGRGIATEDREHVFEKFAVATRRARGAGSGLGLWIVARLVRAHGGRIRLRETDGGGCLFEARIPTTTEDDRRLPP